MNLPKNELTNMDTNEKIDEILDQTAMLVYNIPFKSCGSAIKPIVKKRAKILKSLIHQAEIKELQRHIIWDGDNVGGILMTRQEVDERIKALEKEIV